jgi:hypothetical protein
MPPLTKFSENAKKELDGMDAGLRKLFLKHAEKIISETPPKRFGMPSNVEGVMKQARMIYGRDEGGALYILHCFKSHKEYERWYKSFK